MSLYVNKIWNIKRSELEFCWKVSTYIYTKFLGKICCVNTFFFILRFHFMFRLLFFIHNGQLRLKSWIHWDFILCTFTSYPIIFHVLNLCLLGLLRLNQSVYMYFNTGILTGHAYPRFTHLLSKKSLLYQKLGDALGSYSKYLRNARVNHFKCRIQSVLF